MLMCRYLFDPDNYTRNWDLSRGMSIAQSEYLVDILFRIEVGTDWRDRDRNLITASDVIRC